MLKDTSAWSDVSGGACDDNDLCTKDDQCKDGNCVGTAFTCKSCESCNGNGCTINSGHCVIDDTCHTNNQVNPSEQCQVNRMICVCLLFFCERAFSHRRASRLALVSSGQRSQIKFVTTETPAPTTTSARALVYAKARF